VILGKVVRLKSGAFHQREREGVAQRKLQRRACGGCQIKPARLLFHGHVKNHRGGLSKRRLGSRGKRNQCASSIPQGGQQANHFIAGPAFGQANHHVARLHGSHVAVQGFPCVQEHRFRSRGIQGRRHLGRHVALFPTPVTTTFPVAFAKTSTAWTNDSPRAFDAVARACEASVNVRLPTSRSAWERAGFVLEKEGLFTWQFYVYL